MDEAAPLLLLIATGDPDSDELTEHLREAGYVVARRNDAELASGPDLGGAGPVRAILLAPDLAAPVPAATKAHRLEPLAPAVFLAGPERAAQLQKELTWAAMLGPHRLVLDPNADDFLPSLEVAVRASRQRQSVRTTIDRLNVRLATPPPPASDDYRRLVVSDRYLASILDNARDGIVSSDRKGRLASWNRGAEELYGVSAAEVIGRELTVLVDETERPRLRTLLDKALLGEPTPQQEFACRRWDGTPFTAELTFAPIREEGGAMAVSLTVHDITDRKRTEEDLRRLRDELERRVELRTAELRNANRELEAFTYSVSHDLRTPLRGINGFSQLLLEDYGDKLDAVARSYIERVHAGAIRMGELIDDFLTLARLSRGEPTYREIDLTALAHHVVDDLRRDDPGREVRVTIEEGLAARADPRLLRIVLVNLFANAWKFTREQAEPEVRLCSHGSAGDRVFVVEDNGVGFDMDYADKLFLPFGRLHPAGNFEGTGIGLATVQRILARHGGRIWAESAPGEGARFSFTLPDEPLP